MTLRVIPTPLRKLIAPFAKKVLGGRSQALLWSEWAVSRSKAFLARRSILQGTRIEWPQLGRAWAVPFEVLAPGPDEVLIKTVKSCVSPGTERAMYMSRPNTDVSFPYHPGYSLAGEVIQVGRKVKHLRPGDKVAIAAPHASLAVVHQNQAYPVPPDVSLEEASFIQLGIIALYGLDQGKLQRGERVVVLGRGVIGQLLVQLAASHGASFIASIARTEARSTPPLRQRAHQVIALKHTGKEILDTLEADVTYEATGDPEAIHDAIRVTRPGGRVVLVGSSRGVTSGVDFNTLAEREITLIGAHISGLRRGGQAMVRQKAEVVLQLMATKKLDVASLISEQVNPLEAGWFYRRLAQRENQILAAVFAWDMLTPEERVRRVSLMTLPELWLAKRSEISLAPLPYAEALTNKDR